MAKNKSFRAWFYFRQGWTAYFAFIMAAINVLTVTYFLAIENYPVLQAIFPTFGHYIIIVVGSDCVLHFGDSPKYKRCDECGEKHSNRKDNYCDDCRIFKKEEDTYPEDIYIHCPYYQKDECKSLGGRYDRDQRSWYIPSGINTSNFTKWIEFKKEEKIYINCPYFQKEECKSLGGRYDRDQRSWYIPPNINSNKFKKWMN